MGEQHKEVLQHRFRAWWEQVYFLLISELESPPVRTQDADAVIRWLIDEDNQPVKVLAGPDPLMRLFALLRAAFSCAPRHDGLLRYSTCSPNIGVRFGTMHYCRMPAGLCDG
jgi:hypothetical protein